MVHKGKVKQGKIRIKWEYDECENYVQITAKLLNGPLIEAGGSADGLVKHRFLTGCGFTQDKMYKRAKFEFKVGFIMAGKLWDFLSSETRKHVTSFKHGLEACSSWDEFLEMVGESPRDEKMDCKAPALNQGT